MSNATVSLLAVSLLALSSACDDGADVARAGAQASFRCPACGGGGTFNTASFDAHAFAEVDVSGAYCGDGASWTTTGTAIAFRDLLGNSGGGKYFTGATEAFWSDEGAVCLSVPRNPSVQPAEVECGGQILPVYGSSFEDHPRSVLWTKVNQNGLF